MSLALSQDTSNIKDEIVLSIKVIFLLIWMSSEWALF